MSRLRFPAALFREGGEPDPRFTLANERTFLAWVRTALAFLAAGVALEALGLGLQPSLRLAASVVLVVTGMAVPVQAWLGWFITERALRRGRPLPSALLAAPIAVSAVSVGALVFLGIVLR